jgi:hypothetical protein
MRTLLGLAALVAAVSAVVIVIVRGRRSAPLAGLPALTLRDVPEVFAVLASTGQDGNFAVFLFGADGQPPAPMDALNIQFSIEAGRVGVDWVLLAPPNLEAQSRFVEFFERKAHAVLRRENNQVRYLRVEGERLPELTQEFLVSQFKVTPDQKMDLIAEGFAWAG